ncbi:MAG: Lysine--tRNA ligase [Chlamydiae bacterium]|nr:Lysine--tRNA ligase [Chlamydiota bacterium]
MIPRPPYHDHEEFQNRNQKLAEIKELGVDPFPYRFDPTHTAKQISNDFQRKQLGTSEEAAKGETEKVCLAGRLILFRAMGKNAFANIQEATHKIQLMFNRDLTTVEGLSKLAGITPLKFIEKKIDLGDLIGVEGHLFRTQKGEITVFVKKMTLLCKTLLPLPEKQHGLVDKEMRYRKRWLDLITHEEVRKSFLVRSHMMRIIRDFLHEGQFLEVETPVLQNLYGGAEARPFTTHIHAVDQDVYLRISLEIALKKILVGGIERIYEIGKVFRNEGIDRTHNPEFTMLEAYAAYWDYNDMMRFLEHLIEKIAKELLGTTKIAYELNGDTHEVNVEAPWKRVTMKESIEEFAGFAVDNLSDMEIHRVLQNETAIDPKILSEAPRGALITMLFDEFVVDKLIQPVHITDHPIESTPLCKPHRDPEQKKEGFVERFESFFLGKEICNAYSELNDPLIQRELLELQAIKLEKGDEEAHPLDEEFLEAICQGMPPAAGIGIGLDRLAMLFTNSPSIRDVLYFPIMKPQT